MQSQEVMAYYLNFTNVPVELIKIEKGKLATSVLMCEILIFCSACIFQESHSTQPHRPCMAATRPQTRAEAILLFS